MTGIPARRPTDDASRGIVTDIKRLLECPFVTGNLVVGIQMPSSGNKVVNHGLGRKPSGFIVVRQRVGVPSFYESSSTSSSTTFVSGAVSTVDIWFF